MDSITHLALGAIIGDAYAGNKIGKRAMLIGALAQSIPDCDFVMSFWLSPVDNLLAHRGFAHSILFGMVVSILLGFATTRWGLTTKKWILFFAFEISIHLLLDAFNNYGVGWFEPFNHIRISFNTVFVADPFYSIWLGIGCVALLFLPSSSTYRKFWITGSLITSTLYLGYALHNKSVVSTDIETSLNEQGISHQRILTTPAPFNNWLWYYIAEIDSGYYVGYRSVFDSHNTISPHFFPRRDTLLKAIRATEDVKELLRFSQGYYTVEVDHDTLVFNDLRFGQVAGWSNPEGKFAFHYYVNYPEKNLLVVQRGRFENWNKETIGRFIERIQGE